MIGAAEHEDLDELVQDESVKDAGMGSLLDAGTAGTGTLLTRQA